MASGNQKIENDCFFYIFANILVHSWYLLLVDLDLNVKQVVKIRFVDLALMEDHDNIHQDFMIPYTDRNCLYLITILP